MILVIGGSSKIGSTLLDLLVNQNGSVRMLVRDHRERSRAVVGVEVVTGDLAEKPSLNAAMGGIDKVFLLSSPHPDAVTWHANAIDAARESGVRLVVRSSILGAGGAATGEFITSHTASDEYLAASGVDYVILRPNLFQQNVPESTIPSIDASGQFYVNAGDAKLSMVDTRDVAAVAAAVLTEPGHEGATYDITGPEALSYHDVAIRLSEALGRDIRYIEVSDDASRSTLSGFGMTAWFMDALVGLYQNYRRSGQGGYAARVTETVLRITGRPPRTLDALIAERPGPASVALSPGPFDNVSERNIR